jgi:hypothetical protein
MTENFDLPPQRARGMLCSDNASRPAGWPIGGLCLKGNGGPFSRVKAVGASSLSSICV